MQRSKRTNGNDMTTKKLKNVEMNSNHVPGISAEMQCKM